VLPFDIVLRAGEPPYRQVVHAAAKAMLAGTLQPGDAFPSVRELSQALRINPNTAQKVVAELVRDGLLEVRPGVGTVVTAAPRAAAGERRKLLQDELEPLLVSARRLGITRDEVHAAVDAQWDAAFGRDGEPASRRGTSSRVRQS
jgi:GntR family transcriptional regulator